ncbi:MAG TPA: hypothetical protein VFL56_06810 [Solirubrobacterales bacterium]|nr:hypothetical protein [Solirubrobacterales bacterium]
MIPAGEGLQRDQRRIVVQVEAEVGRRRDLGLAGGPIDPLPADRRYLEPLSNPHSWADVRR